MTPTADQKKALDQIKNWYHWKTGYPFILAGLAGTGKTALLPMLHAELDVRIRYVCPTWKAAGVLSKKLRDADIAEQATSIHNLIYNPRGVLHEDDCATRADSEEECNRGCRKLCWEFDPKEQPELLVVDEASMVDDRIREDLQRLGTSVLYVGDPGQLPPVVGSSIFTQAAPDAELREIQRQAQGSPIIALSRAVRNGDVNWITQAKDLGFDVFRAGKTSTSRYDLNQADPKHDDPETVFIASTNQSVDQLNALARRNLGRGPDDLVSGELIMVQNNNKKTGMFNGQQGVVTKVAGPRLATLRMETGVSYFGPVLLKGIDETPQFAASPVIRHSYAVTCHKAQGSEFKNVVVYLTGARPETTNWLYTAITRSSERLTFVVR